MRRVRDMVMYVKPLRLALFLVALASFVLAPRPGVEPNASAHTIVSTLLVPVMVPVIFITLLLDAFMCRIMMSEHEQGPARQRLARLGWVGLGIAVVMVLFWIPYFRALR